MHRSKATSVTAFAAVLAATGLTAAGAQAQCYDRTVVVRRTYTLPTYDSYPTTTYVAVANPGVAAPVYRSYASYAPRPVYRSYARYVPRPVYVEPTYRVRGLRISFGSFRTAHRGHHVWRSSHRGHHRYIDGSRYRSHHRSRHWRR